MHFGTSDGCFIVQSCEKTMDEIVNDSVGKILNLIQQLCVECGKVSAVLDLCPQTLADPKAASLEQMISQKAACADDLLNAEVCAIVHWSENINDIHFLIYFAPFSFFLMLK